MSEARADHEPASESTERPTESVRYPALRDGRFVVLVLAPTEERKIRAGEILRDHGARFVNFLGRFEIEVLHR